MNREDFNVNKFENLSKWIIFRNIDYQNLSNRVRKCKQIDFHSKNKEKLLHYPTRKGPGPGGFKEKL